MAKAAVKETVTDKNKQGEKKKVVKAGKTKTIEVSKSPEIKAKAPKKKARKTSPKVKKVKI